MMNKESKTPQNTSASFSPEEMRYYSNRERILQSEAADIRRTKRRTALSVIAIAISITAITLCGFTMWRVIHAELTMKEMQRETSELSDSKQYDKARDVAKRDKYRASDTWDFIKRLFAGNLEEDIIDREEAENLRKNGITIGRSSSDFLGLTYEEAQEELENRGFKDVTSSYIISDARKYKKTEEGMVIGIRIGDREKFNADEKILPDTPIEIYYLKKITPSSTSPTAEPEPDSSADSIVISRSSSGFSILTYEAAENELRSRGFTNVTPTPIVDNSNKYKGKASGTVIKVKIDGKEKFSAEDEFSADAEIQILYLIRDTDDEDGTPSIPDSQDRPITIGKSSKELIGMSLDDVREFLINKGFNEQTIIDSSIESQSRKYKKTEDGAVISIAINGKTKFKETDKFAPDSIIEIQFYKKDNP